MCVGEKLSRRRRPRRTQKAVNMSSTFEHPKMLMIDELSGKLWAIPTSSRLRQWTAPSKISDDVFNANVDFARHDVNSFVNAEQLLGICESQRPISSVWATTDARVVYCKEIAIEGRYGCQSNFLWALSFAQQTNVYATAVQMTHQLLGFGASVSPPLLEASGMALRPNPSVILGAELVEDLTLLRPQDREFLLRAPTAPYLFRDASDALVDFWKATKRHKEAAPGRQHLFANLNRAKTVVQKTPLPPARRETIFFGENGLPQDIQEKIVQLVVQDALLTCESKRAQRQFSAIVCTATLFKSIAVAFVETQLRDAINSLAAFVCTGEPFAAHRARFISNWSYREMCAPPQLLLSLSRPVRAPGTLATEFFAKRVSSKLSAGVCRARQKLDAELAQASVVFPPFVLALRERAVAR